MSRCGGDVGGREREGILRQSTRSIISRRKRRSQGGRSREEEEVQLEACEANEERRVTAAASDEMT